MALYPRWYGAPFPRSLSMHVLNKQKKGEGKTQIKTSIMVPPGGESPAAYRTPPTNKDTQQSHTSEPWPPQVAEERKSNEENTKHSVPVHYVNFPFLCFGTV